MVIDRPAFASSILPDSASDPLPQNSTDSESASVVVAEIVWLPPLISTPAFEPRLSNRNDPPAPLEVFTPDVFDSTIEPTSVGASSVTFSAPAVLVMKCAVAPAAFGTPLAQLPLVCHEPPAATFHAGPMFALPAKNALS